MMDWRRWVRAVLEWLGLAGPANALSGVGETAVSSPQPPQPKTASIARSTTAFSLHLVQVGPDRESVIHLPDNTFFLFGDYDVVLQAPGPQPDRVIQILRDVLNGRTRADVEHMVADTPRQIVQQVPLETAETIKIRLERVGAAVEIVRRQHND